MTEGSERRQCQRGPVTLEGSFKAGDASDQEPFLGSTVDIGQGGLRLRMSQQPTLKEGDSIALRIGNGEVKTAIDILGEVRWIKPCPDSASEWYVGVRLSESELAKWALWLDQVSSVFAGLLGVEDS